MKLNIIWKDEFDKQYGASPDVKNWRLEVGGHGWGNQELQFYTSSTDNAFHDGNSSLVVKANLLATAPGGTLWAWYGPARYTSARLVTKDTFEFFYGRVEARIKLPDAKGVWPAFWLIGANYPQTPWPDCGEIDIMEFIGGKNGYIYGSLHGPGYSHQNRSQKIGVYVPDEYHDFINNFHIFSLEWEPHQIKWFVDDREFHSVTFDQVAEKRWVFDAPFFLVLNLAIGGTWAGQPDTDEKFPQLMLIDYVRVYEPGFSKSIIPVNLQRDGHCNDHEQYIPPPYNHPQVRGKVFERILPSGGVCAEIGVHRGSNISTIMEATIPERLHLIDPWYLLGKEWVWGSGNRSTVDALCRILQVFEDELVKGKIRLHIGFDLEVLPTFPDYYFDWVYLDTSHQYRQTLSELELLQRKIKFEGIIMGDDWFPEPEHIHNGLFLAVQEFIAQENFELIYANVENRQWAIRRRQA